MTATLGLTFRLPHGLPCVPEECPQQIAVADHPTAEEELAAYQVVECWDQLAGLLLRKSFVAGTGMACRRWREQAEAVTAVSAELFQALYQRTQARFMEEAE